MKAQGKQIIKTRCLQYNNLNRFLNLKSSQKHLIVFMQAGQDRHLWKNKLLLVKVHLKDKKLKEQ